MKEEALKVPAADLAEEGISAEDLAQYGEMVTFYKSLSTSTREAIIARTAHTHKFVALFQKAKQLVKNSLDRLATQYKQKDPDFYLQYRAARNVIHRGPSNSKVVGKKQQGIANLNTYGFY